MANQTDLLGAAFCKGNLSLGSPPQPQLASAQEINTSCFRPGPSALHRVKLSWDAPGSLGTAALLGVSSARNPLPTGSPSLGCRIGCAKVFCAQAPSMPPEPAWLLSAEAPSQRRPMTSFWELHSAKGNSPRAANHTPNAHWLRKAVQVFFLTRRRPPRSALLPYAALVRSGPAALLGLSSARNPIPTGSSSWGGRIGCAKGFCTQPPAMPPEPARPLSAEAPSQRRPKTSFWELHFAKGNSPWAAHHSLNLPRRRKSTQAVFAPGPPLSIGRS